MNTNTNINQPNTFVKEKYDEEQGNREEYKYDDDDDDDYDDDDDDDDDDDYDDTAGYTVTSTGLTEAAVARATLAFVHAG